MSLKTCPKCGKTIECEQNTCPECGCVLVTETTNIEDPTSTSSSPAQEIHTNHRKKAIIAVVFVVLAVSIICFFMSQNNKQEYVQTIESARYIMLKGTAEAETTCNLVSSVWHDTIFKEINASTMQYTMQSGRFYDDFNDALTALLSSEEYTEHSITIQACQEVAAKYMQELRKPPKELEVCYETLCKMYEEFTAYTDLAINPTGSLNTFNQNYQTYGTTFLQYYNTLDTQIPKQ